MAERMSAAKGVIEAITRMVRTGEYPHGARLPSERDLALRLGVSRATVRNAISALARNGVLEARQGAGTVVSATGENVLKVPFEMLLLLERPSLEELYEVRELVEVHLAGRAAERRTEEDLERIRRALEAMRATVDAPERQFDPNVAFHEAIARAARLPVLERFLVSLHDSIRAAVEATLPGELDRMASFEAHERIYEAIRRGSVGDARRAMTVHMALAIDEVQRLAAQKAREEGTEG